MTVSDVEANLTLDSEKKGHARVVWSDGSNSSTPMRPCRVRRDGVLYPATRDPPPLPRLSGVVNTVWGDNSQIWSYQSSHCERKSSESWVPADRRDGKICVTAGGCRLLRPKPYEVLEPFSPTKNVLSCTCTCFLLRSVFLPLFRFNTGIFYCFILLFFLTFSTSPPFSISLICCGLDCACFIWCLMSHVLLGWFWSPLQFSVWIHRSLFLLSPNCYWVSTV